MLASRSAAVNLGDPGGMPLGTGGGLAFGTDAGICMRVYVYRHLGNPFCAEAGYSGQIFLSGALHRSYSTNRRTMP
jgi:hypothetical protein